MMKFIVTGSEGFIGKALCQRLKKSGVEVLGIDRKNGNEAAVKVPELLAKEKIDCVYHLAAQTSVFNNNINQIFEDNIRTFMVVADACREHRVKLVYASSSTANSCNTTSMYGISKRFDEQYAACYCKNATGVRLHNVYGPNPRQGTLLWSLVYGKSARLFNNGRNIRCFTYIDDAVEGLIYAFNSSYKLVNVVNRMPMSIYDFSKIVQKYNGIELNLEGNMRDFDNLEQLVDDSIFTVPLLYTSVNAGIKIVMDAQKK